MARTAWLSLLGLLYVAGSCRADAPFCRCTSEDACWPSAAEFDTLAQQVSQPLIQLMPPAQPCYIDANSSDCTAVENGWTDGVWRSDQPGAMQSTNFETFTFPNGTIDACYLNVSLNVPCHQGSVSVIGVNASTVSDVQAAVTFAAQHNLSLVVKNTGHDYFGRSDRRGSFVIWTHHMKNITVHTSFLPAGAPDNVTGEHAITIGAGVQWHETYAAVNASGRSIVGGVAAGGSVGSAGGWPLGGGHSALSPTFGLGVDNVLEIELVTSTGEHLTVNAYQHPDLFWALRGGGGGTFGIVTALTYRTHPLVPIIGAFFNATATLNGTTPAANAPLVQAFAELVRLTPNLTDTHWGGYTMLDPAADDNLSFSFVYVLPNASWAAANATIDPFFDFARAVAANSSGALVVTETSTQPFASFFDWYTRVIPPTGGVGTNIELGTWLLPRDTLEADPAHTAAVLLDGPGVEYYLVAGGVVSEVDPDVAGINPAWRKANVHVITGALWDEGATSEFIDAQRQDLARRTANMRALAPESGAYFNEASLFEPNFQQAFFGSHYDALKAIKQVYDPLDLFVVTEGVGSEDWDKALKCRLT
ncbi:FAD-binding domain-containing protein [Lenzites betulinus]|nr:FAD-binding domain-containing protein [Lenzites betulinus]